MAANDTKTHISGKVSAEPAIEDVETTERFILRLPTSFSYEGKVYDEFTFDFTLLTSEDMAVVEREMTDDNEYALSPEFSTSYLLRLAAKAAGVPYEVIKKLPLPYGNRIRVKARNFIRSSE